MKQQIKSGLGALRKTASNIREESQLLKQIGQMVEACLKEPTTALQKFETFMEERRRSNRMGPGEGFVRITVEGEVVLLTAEEAQQFIDEAEDGPAQEKRLAGKVKRILTCQPEELFAEATFIRMLVEATLGKYHKDIEGDDSTDAKILKDLLNSVETRLKRRVVALEQDNSTLETTEKTVSTHRKQSGMDEFESNLQQFQKARMSGDQATAQQLGAWLPQARATYERAVNAISPSIRTCKLTRRDIQVHIGVFLRYLEALVHKKKESLVSSVSQMRSSIEDSGGSPSAELLEKERELETIEQQENFVSKQARESEAVVAAVNAAENLPESAPQADVEDIMSKADLQAMKKKPAAPQPAEAAEPEAKKSIGMHTRKE